MNLFDIDISDDIEYPDPSVSSTFGAQRGAAMRSIQNSASEVQREDQAFCNRRQPSNDVSAGNSDLAMLAEAAETMTTGASLGVQCPPPIHREVTVDPADANASLVIQREIESCRQELERLQGELIHAPATRSDYRRSIPEYGTQPVQASGREVANLEVVDHGVPVMANSSSYGATFIDGRRPVNCSSTRRPTPASARAGQVHFKSADRTDPRQSQTSMYQTPKELPRVKKHHNGSSSPSSSSDHSRRGSSDRHVTRRRHYDNSLHRRKEDGRERDGNNPHRRRQHTRHHRSPSSDDSNSSGSRSRRPARSRQLKPEKFSGQGSVETFLMQFENCSTYNHWSASDKAAHLRWSLSGSAAQLLWDNEKISYKELIGKLRDRYGGKGSEEKFQTELRCRRRRRGEAVKELAQDIRRIMSLAYPNEKSSLSEHLARDAFLAALDDPEMELKVREREPSTLDDAVKLAQRFEVFKSTVEGSLANRNKVNRKIDKEEDEKVASMESRIAQLERNMHISHDEQDENLPSPSPDGDIQSPKANVRKRSQKDRRFKQSRSVTEKNDEKWKNDIMAKLDEVTASQKTSEDLAHRLMAENDALTKEVGRLQYLEQRRSVPSPSAPAFQYEPRTSTQQPTTRGSCYNCGQTGHFSRQCPEQRRPAAQHRPNGRTQDPSLSVNVASRARRSQSAAAYLLVEIGGKFTSCLLDSGSEISLLPPSMIDDAQILPTSQSLRAANETQISVLGQVTLHARIGLHETTVCGLVSDHVSEVILGLDWLAVNKVTWDFGHNRIQLGGQQFTLRLKHSSDHWCRRVVLNADTVIPPRSQVDLSTHVVFHSSSDWKSTAEWATEPKIIHPGVYSARTLVSSTSIADVPVRVMNVKPQSVRIKAGTNLADLQPVEVDESESVCSASTTTKPTVIDKLNVPEFVRDLVNGSHSSLSDSFRRTLVDILCSYEDVFSKSENDLGLTDIVTHQIDTGNARPIRQPLRRYPPAHVEAISEHVDTMLAQGTIEAASSPWASNVVLVKKKDGSLRCCIDYRQVNSLTRKDAYPLPRIDACLDAMSGAQWFSTFDLRSSYHQVKVDPKDSDKTAFICPRGMYRFRTMPFGLCNAGATFQRLMDIVMSGLHPEICLIYLDDIIVFSASAEQHLERLITVLARLRTAGLKLKPQKCAFFQKSVSFLGHVISEKGIATDPIKTEAVVQWPVPRNVKELRSFIGLSSYYRRFVKDFANIAAPLHELQKQGRPFRWTSEAQEAFETLKGALASPPILAMPNDTGQFVLDTDASDVAIGAVLSQVQDGVEKVIAFASRSLDRRECNYCVTRRELLAVVHFLKHFKQYLLGRHFTVRTDHAPLTWLRHTPEPIGQQARWLEVMEEYDFTVAHRSGKKHTNADALSRRPCTWAECACNVDVTGTVETDVFAVGCQEHDRETSYEEDVPHTFGGAADHPVTECNHDSNDDDGDVPPDTILPWTFEGIVHAQRNDPDIGIIVKLLESSAERPSWEAVALCSTDTKALWHQWPRLIIQQDLLRRRFESADGKIVKWQIVWPSALRCQLLEIAHGGMTGGHLGRRRTAATIQSRIYWPTWSADLDEFLRSCPQCSQYHRGKIRPQAELQTPMVGEPFERVSIDITGPHPRSGKGRRFILTLVDHFSKWAEAIPLASHTATVVARALVEHVFARFGAPKQLLSDRGSEFESELFRDLMALYGIDKLRTTPYKPSTNGMVERFHRTLNSMLGKVVGDSQRDWDEVLPQVMAAYRGTRHDATGYSPNMLFLGREVSTALDLIMGLPSDQNSVCDDYDDFVQRVRQHSTEAFQIAREHLKKNAERRKSSYDIRVRKQQFQAGDWVWYYYPRRYKRKSPKWQKHYTGPYLVIRVIPPSNYVLQKSPRSKAFVVHTDKLKKCFGNTPTSWLSSAETDVSESSREQSPVPKMCSEPPHYVSPHRPSENRRRQEPLLRDEVIPDELSDDPYTESRRRRYPRKYRRPARFEDYVCGTIKLSRNNLTRVAVC